MRFGFCVGLVALAFGCSKEEEHEPVGPICTDLGEICHEAGESGDPDAEACHEVGHGGDEAECEARLADCTALCEAIDDTGA